MESLYRSCAQKCFRWQSLGENKQTNMQLSVGELARLRLHLYFTACQSRASPPLDPEPPQALLLEQSPRCVRLLWGVGLGERWAASTAARIEAIRAS